MRIEVKNTNLTLFNTEKSIQAYSKSSLSKKADAIGYQQFTSDASDNNPKGHLDSFKGKAKKQIKGRKRLSIDQAPSLSGYAQPLDILIKGHAYIGCQMIQAMFERCIGICIRSKQEPQSDFSNTPTISPVKVKADHAIMTVGEISHNKENIPSHMSHMNRVAHIWDDSGEKVERRIYHEKQVTPNTKETFRTQGVPEQILKEIEEQPFNPQLVKQIFDTYWPRHSFFAGNGREFEIQMNACTELPAELNLDCDGRIERALRPKIANLIRLCMSEKTSSKEERKKVIDNYTQKYVELHWDYFNLAMSDIEERISFLQQYQKAVLECFDFEQRYASMPLDTIPEQEIHTYLENLATVQKIRKENFDIHKIGAPRPLLTKTYRYFKSRRFKLPYPTGALAVRMIQQMWKNCKPADPAKQSEIKEEMSKRWAFYMRLKEYCLWEKEGTRVPVIRVERAKRPLLLADEPCPKKPYKPLHES